MSEKEPIADFYTDLHARLEDSLGERTDEFISVLRSCCPNWERGENDFKRTISTVATLVQKGQWIENYQSK